MQRLSRFARYWDMIANSGRYPRTLPLLLGDAPFHRFMAFSDWLYARTGQTHAIAHERMVHLLQTFMTTDAGLPADAVDRALIDDYRGQGGRSRLAFEAPDAELPSPMPKRRQATPARQARHLAGTAAGAASRRDAGLDD